MGWGKFLNENLQEYLLYNFKILDDNRLFYQWLFIVNLLNTMAKVQVY